MYEINETFHSFPNLPTQNVSVHVPTTSEGCTQAQAQGHHPPTSHFQRESRSFSGENSSSSRPALPPTLSLTLPLVLTLPLPHSLSVVCLSLLPSLPPSLHPFLFSFKHGRVREGERMKHILTRNCQQTTNKMQPFSTRYF